MIRRSRDLALRHAQGVAVAIAAISVAAFAAYLSAYASLGLPPGTDQAELLYAACQVLPYGLVGAVLVARRPDLAFGWLLSVAAVALAVQAVLVGPAVWWLQHDRHAALAGWLVPFGSLAFVPVAMEGLVNVRFPSGRPTGRWGRLAERVLVAGTVIALLGGLLGDETLRSIFPDGVPEGAARPFDGTWLSTAANATVVAVPLVILLGVLVGIGIVVRWARSEGVERQQLGWRAAGVVAALAMFPFAVTESLPDWASDVAPLLFVVTLVVPVLRYDLWAIDSLVRRSAAYSLQSSGTTVHNMLRALADMLRLPYVAVLRDGAAVAGRGEPAAVVETWPLVHDGTPVGELVAAPRHGRSEIDTADRQVLQAFAQLLAGSVRAEALTADLQDARHRLVAAREEERRRLRRDLHDGLGPLLTGLGLNLDAALAHLDRDDARAATYLDNAREASAQVITDLRDLVQGLRPPALDDLGFSGALQLHTERIAREAGRSLTLALPDQLALPAAVEVAAYRTVLEGVTNVVRHSCAATIAVTVTREEHRLLVEVTDDGRSAGPWSPSVGLTSMRERAEELGGSLHAGPTAEGGRVRACYPLPGGAT